MSLSSIQLYSAIAASNWQAVIKQLQDDPSLAKIASSAYGDEFLPLHAVCVATFQTAPLRLFKMLLLANPAAAQVKAGAHDRLPIHHLLASSIRTGVPPSEEAVSALIEVYPGAARVPDANNDLPIHLACQVIGVSDKVLTFILSTYPEGAYLRDYHGKYPLDYATSNKDINTKKVALAALDRGTLYASISKMTSKRLSQENESKTRSIEEVYEKKLNKMEHHSKEERAKLKAQLDAMTKQFEEEKKRTQSLRDEKEQILIEKDQAVARAVQFEKAHHAKLEQKIRSELADVQLKNMDMLDQLESTQVDLDTSKEMEEMHTDKIDFLNQTLSQTNKTLDDTKEELNKTQVEMKGVQDELASAMNVIKEKSAVISHLEQCLRDAKSSVLHLIQDHERMQADMEKQKESLGVFISQQISAEKDAKTSLLKMSLLVDAINVAEGEAKVNVPSVSAKEVQTEAMPCEEVATEGQ